MVVCTIRVEKTLDCRTIFVPLSARFSAPKKRINIASGPFVRIPVSRSPEERPIHKSRGSDNFMTATLNPVVYFPWDYLDRLAPISVL